MKVSHCIPQLVGVADCPVTPIVYTAGRPVSAIDWQCSGVWNLTSNYRGIIINDDERESRDDRRETNNDLQSRYPDAKIYEYGVQHIDPIKHYFIATNMDEAVSPRSNLKNSLRKFVNALPTSDKKIVLLQDRTKPEQGYMLAREAYLVELAAFCKKNKLDIVVWTEAFTGGWNEPQLVAEAGANESTRIKYQYIVSYLNTIIETLKKASV